MELDLMGVAWVCVGMLNGGKSSDAIRKES